MRRPFYFAILALGLFGVLNCNGPTTAGTNPTPADSGVTPPSADGTAIIDHPSKLKFPPLTVTIPKPQREELDNGLVVYLMERHELPLVDIVIRVKTGAFYDPPDKLGLANLTAALMRDGGTAKLAPEELDAQLESMAAELSVSVDYQEINFNLSVLREDLDKGLQLLADILREPRLDEKKLDFEKKQLAEGFRRQNDRAQDIAYRELRKAVYAGHPFGNRVVGNPETVQKISRDDITRFYRQYVCPNNLFLGAAGDFQAREILTLIKQKLGNWPQQPIIRPNIPPLELKYKKDICFFPKETRQTAIMMGHLSPTRLSPDYFPLLLMNAILGSSSDARLNHRIREKEGLTYGVFSSFLYDIRDPAMFIVETNTDNKTVGRVTRLILEQVDKMRTEPVEDAELKHTKESILNGFVFRFTSPTYILDQYIFMESIGLPKDYLETYRDNIMKVTKEDIQEVAQKYLHPDDFISVFVGNEAEIKSQIQEFGPVRYLNQKEK